MVAARISSVCWFALAAIAAAQTTAPREFDSASVKLTASSGDRKFVQISPGRLEIRNASLHRLIVLAWGLLDYQISGEPDWVSADRYDIQVSAGSSLFVQDMEGPALRAALEDRFRLKVHREAKELPAFDLTVAEGGPKFERSRRGSCLPWSPDMPPPARISPPQAKPGYCGFPIFKNSGPKGEARSLDGVEMTMPGLAETLSRDSGLSQVILDRTGLTGGFDLHLQWTLESGGTGATVGPSIFTALHEQLGLNLEQSKGPVNTLVIDRVERPSPN